MNLSKIVYINLDENKWAMVFEKDFLKVQDFVASYPLKDLENILFKTRTIDGATVKRIISKSLRLTIFDFFFCSRGNCNLLHILIKNPFRIPEESFAV